MLNLLIFVKICLGGEEMKVLSVKDVMGMFGVSRITIYNWTKKNGLPHYKIGETLRFKEEEVLQWLESKKQNN